MRVIVAGMHRSGTTWLFNTVRIGVLESGLSLHSCFDSELDPKNPAQVHVQKTHRYCEPNGAKVLMMYRDLRGVAASAVRMGLTDEAGVLKYVEACVRDEDRVYADVADLRLRFEEMMQDRVAATAAVLDALDLSVNPEWVSTKVSVLRPPDSGVDPETHLHAGHVTSGDPTDWSPLPDATLRDTEGAFGNWLADHRYPI